MFTMLACLLSLGEIQSTQDLQFSGIVKQGFDFSCGVAASATLLGFYGVATSESELLAELAGRAVSPDDYANGQLQINLANLMDILAAHGIQSRAYRMTMEQMKDALRRNYAPLLVHYDEPKPHFTLVIGIDRGLVLCADPTMGLVGIAQERFITMWSGAVLATASVVQQRDQEKLEKARKAIVGRRDLLDRLP